MSRLAGFVVRHRRAVIAVVDHRTDRHGRDRVVRLLGALVRVRGRNVDRVGPGRRSDLDELAETGGQLAIIADGIDVDEPSASSARDHAGAAPIAALDGVIDVADPWSSGARRSPRHRRSRGARRGHPGRRPRRRGRARRRQRRSRTSPIGFDAPEVLVGGDVLVSETFAHRVGERPPARRGDRPAHRHRGDGDPARRPRRGRACRCSSRWAVC